MVFFPRLIVPPGGHAGFQQMTPASKVALSKIGRTLTNFTRRRRRKTKASAPRKRKSKRSPKFGGPAWRKMYGLDKKRRKRRAR